MDNTSSKSRFGQRKLSGTMSRISSSTFSRRRNTTTTLPSSVSSIQLNHQSRLPTPSGIPKSTSFLCSLNHFNHPSIDENQAPQPIEQHRLPKRSSQEPSSNRRTSQIPRAASRTARKPDCSVKIEQRGLMQPMQPPLPRSSTMGHLSSSQSLGILQENRSTGGTDARKDVRRQSIVLNKDNQTLTPPTRLVKLQKTPSGVFPKRKDSLMAPPPATAIVAPVQYAAVSEAVAPQRAVSYEEEDTVIISKEFAPTPPPKTPTRITVRNISYFQEELGETEETDHHHASTVPSTPMPWPAHEYAPRSPLLAPAPYDQDEDPRFVSLSNELVRFFRKGLQDLTGLGNGRYTTPSNRLTGWDDTQRSPTSSTPVLYPNQYPPPSIQKTESPECPCPFPLLPPLPVTYSVAAHTQCRTRPRG